MIPDSAAALVWLANYGALELHPWTSRASGPQHPTWLLFDIDPGSHTSFEDVLVLARLHRTVLDRLARVGDPFAPLLDVEQALPSIDHVPK